MSLSSAEIKRQILMSAGTSDIKRRMDENPPGISEGEMIEIGNDLEAVTRMRGWPLIESYMLRRMNLVGLAYANSDEGNKKGAIPVEVQRGIARGYIELMQWIQVSIQVKDEIIQKERAKHETKDVPKDEADKGI